MRTKKRLDLLAEKVLADASRTDMKPQGVPVASGLRAWFEVIDYKERVRPSIVIKTADGTVVQRFISGTVTSLSRLRRIPVYHKESAPYGLSS